MQVAKCHLVIVSGAHRETIRHKYSRAAERCTGLFDEQDSLRTPVTSFGNPLRLALRMIRMQRSAALVTTCVFNRSSFMSGGTQRSARRLKSAPKQLHGEIFILKKVQLLFTY